MVEVGVGVDVEEEGVSVSRVHFQGRCTSMKQLLTIFLHLVLILPFDVSLNKRENKVNFFFFYIMMLVLKFRTNYYLLVGMLLT